MSYSLSNGSITVYLQATADATYGDPKIQNMKSTKESQTWEIAMPASDSNATIVIDLLGTKKTITISGITKGTVTQLDSFVNNMEGFLNSNQFILAAGGLTFTADRPASTSITVIMKSFDWEYDAGTVNAINWTASLIQGNS
jgi:hypothetical protein